MHELGQGGLGSMSQSAPLNHADGPRTLPLITIVVPVFNNVAFVPELLRRVEETRFTKLEVVIVDDHSSQPFELPSTSVSCRLVRNERNLGKAHSVNVGVRAAKGRYIVITDPDVVPSADLFDAWLAAFENEPELGIAGAYVYYRAHPTRLTHAGALRESRPPRIVRRLVNSVDSGQSARSIRDPRLVFDDIFMVSKAAWDRVGGMDDDNFDTFYEDADLQYRIARSGFEIELVGGARAFHSEDISGSSLLSARWGARVLGDYKLRGLVRNRMVFLRKHHLISRYLILPDSLLVVAMYSLLILQSSTSVKVKRERLHALVRATIQGVAHPITKR